jgi:lyso-ornithine lipid O-acyltransferase
VSAAAATGRAWRPGTAVTAARLLPLIIALAGFVLALGPPRRAAQRLGFRFGSGFPVYFQHLLCSGLGVRVRRCGVFAAASKQLIVSNHVSWLDIPVLASLEPMSFLAKKEIGNHWLGRELVALQGAIYVDRRRRSTIPVVNMSIVEAMRRHCAVVLFAEATTGDGNRLLRFRSSHFEAARIAASSDGERHAVIQPVYLHYSRIAGLPTSRWQRPRIAWYGDMTFLRHFLQYVRIGGVTCEVHLGPPIRIGPETDRKTAARLTEAAVRALATKAHSGEDMQLARR